MQHDEGASGVDGAKAAAPTLPRRSAQGHLEPQLRETRGRGDGTPFAPFAGATEQPDADTEVSAAAGFADGTRRGRHAEDRDDAEQAAGPPGQRTGSRRARASGSDAGPASGSTVCPPGQGPAR